MKNQIPITTQHIAQQCLWLLSQDLEELAAGWPDVVWPGAHGASDGYATGNNGTIQLWAPVVGVSVRHLKMPFDSFSKEFLAPAVAQLAGQIKARAASIRLTGMHMLPILRDCDDGYSAACGPIACRVMTSYRGGDESRDVSPRIDCLFGVA